MGIIVAAAAVMELIGVQRARGRDLATGIVLGAGFGLAALFLYLGTISSSTTGATVTILFGSIFALDASTLPLVAVLGAIALGDDLVDLPTAAARLGQPRARRPRGASRCGSIGCLYLLALAARGRAVCADDRLDPLDRAAGRPGRHRAAAHRRPGRAIVCRRG